MKVSNDGLLMLAAFEGIELEAYIDQANHWTIGIGHTSMAGNPAPKAGMKITLEDAFQLFIKDIQKYADEVSNKVTTQLEQYEFDALVCWHYNLGRIGNSTLTTKLNDGDKKGAAAEFKKWNKLTQNGVKRASKGLTIRRQKEEVCFVDADYGDDKVAIRFSKNRKTQAWTKDELLPHLLNAKGAAKVESSDIAIEEENREYLKVANPNSNLLPKLRPHLSSRDCLATFKQFKHLLPKHRQNDNVYVLAVRGYYEDTMGAEGANDRGLYDDAMFVIEPEKIHNFNANTDPSKYRKNIANLKTRQAVLYHPGQHGISRPDGGYPAFRQKSPVTVIRDKVGEDCDENKSFFWINLHRGGINTTSSLGCQTVPPHQWDEFKKLVDQLLKEYHQKDFYYILIDEKDMIRLPQKTTDIKAMPAPKTKSSNDNESIETLIYALQKLIKRQEKANESNDTGLTESNDIAQALIEKMQAAGAIKVKKELTSVNAALGNTIGQLLDGKKTVIGVVGLLITSLVPSLETIVPKLGSIINIITDSNDIVEPLLSGTLLWGVLGKVEKWIKN